MKKAVLLGVLMMFITIPSQAQFLKNLQKKVEKRVENTVTNKVADKAAAEAGKSVDNMLNFQMANSGFATGFEQVDPSEIPEIYEFDWSYVVKMETRDGDMILNYFLKKDAPYFGFKLPDNDMFMVMDPSKKINVMYMRAEGNNMVMATRIPESNSAELAADKKQADEFSFKKIANKTIMGYDCSGYQGENKEMVFTFYVTREPDISFGDIYKSDKTNLPKGFDPQWIEDGNGIMMQMIMEGKKNAKENATLTCIALEKKPFNIKKSDYNSSAGN
ncbi:DUF4412 domain-containing protein [Antarcticibacterium arcticum]|nr:DUF4412 domain-containing protein [Antarcticibacterium arcticum]